MECLQIIKFIYKKNRLNFTAGFKPIRERTVRIPDGGLLSDLLEEGSDEATDELLKVFGEEDTDDEAL
jgi:hypothetical protein